MDLYNRLLPSQMQNTWQDSLQHPCTQRPTQSWQNSPAQECSLQIKDQVEGQTFQPAVDQAQRQMQDNSGASVKRWWGIMWTQHTAWWKMRSLRSEMLAQGKLHPCSGNNRLHHIFKVCQKIFPRHTLATILICHGHSEAAPDEATGDSSSNCLRAHVQNCPRELDEPSGHGSKRNSWIDMTSRSWRTGIDKEGQEKDIGYTHVRRKLGSLHVH